MTVSFWCVLAATLLPYICFGIAVNTARRSGTPRDNSNPRDFPKKLEGLPKRAWAAHLNSFESLPGFAAAVIIANIAQAAQTQIDTLAVIWVIARIAYVLLYLLDRNTLRSGAQFVSLFCVFGLFVAAGLSGANP